MGDFGQSRSMRSRSRSASTLDAGMRRLSSVKRFAARLALVGAFDVLGFAIGTENHADTSAIVSIMTNDELECQSTIIRH